MNKRITKLLSVFIIAGAIGAGAAFAATGCSNKPDDPPKQEQTDGITSVTVKAAGNATTVANGGTLQLSAEVVVTGSAAKTVTWSIKSGAEASEATISTDGKLTAGTVAGKVTVVATSTVDDTKKGELEITVQSAQHAHDYKWVDNGDGTHSEKCGEAGCDTPVKGTPEEHKYDDELDADCNKCGYARYEEVKTSVDFIAAAKALNNGVETTSNMTVGEKGYSYYGKLDFGTGSRFEPGKNCVNTQKKDIVITLGGKVNSIKIVGKGASGTAGDIILKDSSGAEKGKATSTGNGVDISIEADNLPEGTYTLVSGTSVRLYEITLTELTEKGTPTEISSVNPTKTDFLIGDTFISEGTTAMIGYTNGAQKAQSNLQIDSSAVNTNVAGKYTVNVSYTENAKTVNGSYDVYVYTVDTIEAHTIGLASNKQVTLQQAAVTGGTLSTDYLTVKGTGTTEGRTKSFNLPAAALDIQAPAITAAGEVTVNYSVNTAYTTGGKALTGSYKVMVKDKKPVTKNIVEVTVGETGEFKTVTQAVQYLKACNYEASVNKIIKVQAGTYTEKVWLDLDNVTLVGLGTNVDDTKLTYSLVEGDKDAITNSVWGLTCATLHVTGKNFKAYNIAIRNDFDYIANADKYSGNQAAQGVALTLEGDGAVIYNCHLFGNQDTLYMKSGRSYYYKSQIDGNVDFIFGGETGLAFFEECEIKAIYRGKAENGHVAVPQHSDSKKPAYGYIFYKCNLTDDGEVDAGGMTLGRPWGKRATVAYIECKFSAAYAQKWVDMSGNKPADADFCVYGATDATGTPITATPEGGKVLTADEAALYTKANIFGTANGKVGYTTVFECDAEYAKLRILAGIDEGELPTETKIDISLKDETLPDKDCVAAINEKYAGKFTWTGAGSFEVAKPQNGVKIGTDTIITFDVVGEVAVVAGYELPASDYVISYKDGKATVKFVAATGQYGSYVGGFIIDTAKTPADTQLVTVTLDYNDGGTTANKEVQAVAGVPYAKPADPVRDGYKFTGWKLNGADYDFTANVTAAITLVAQWEAQNDYNLTAGGTVNLYEFTTGQVQAGTATYRGIIVDATTGKFAPRTNGDVQVNAGVKLKFKVNAGTTADKITVTFTAAAGDAYIPTFTLSVETVGTDTYAVVSISNNCYPSTMTVAIA